MKREIMKNINWSDVLEKVIIAAIIGIFATSIAFYISTSIDKGVRIEKERIQQEQLDRNQEDINRLIKNDTYIINLVDSTQFGNSCEHNDIILELNSVEQELKNLIFVIGKNNKEMYKEILELKQLQRSENYLSSKE